MERFKAQHALRYVSVCNFLTFLRIIAYLLEMIEILEIFIQCLFLSFQPTPEQEETLFFFLWIMSD